MIPRERLAALRCRFPMCSAPPEVVVHVPAGCWCWSDPIQALCGQHLLTLESVGPIDVLIDMRLSSSCREAE